MEDYIEKLLEKYQPIDLTIKGNAIPNEWEWDDDSYNVEVKDEHTSGSNEQRFTEKNLKRNV